MKLCRTCRYGSEYELDKPCIVYREDCPLYQKEGDEMTREEAIKMLEYIKHIGNGESEYKNDAQAIAIDMAIKALENIGHLTDRPCDVCEFHTDGCSQWKCIFCDELFGGMRR